MSRIMDRLTNLRVADVMNTDVVEISAHQTMDDAARLLATHDISGAPVVDEMGRCVGVISATDFVRRERARSQSDDPSLRMEEHALAHESTEEPYQIVESGSDLVGDYMSKAVQSISRDATLATAAQIMCVEHVHRLPVLGSDGRVLGVMSSLDLVAAVLNAVDEHEADKRTRRDVTGM